LYDIQPENGAGLFLRPRSPHGEHTFHEFLHVTGQVRSHNIL